MTAPVSKQPDDLDFAAVLLTNAIPHAVWIGAASDSNYRAIVSQAVADFAREVVREHDRALIQGHRN